MEHRNSAMKAAQSTLMGDAASKVGEGHLDSIERQIRVAADRAASLGARADMIVDRLFGPGRTEAGGVSPMPEPSGKLPEINNTLARLGTAIDYVERSVSRLEDL